ncbi:uncharacterized protein LOC128643238 [Bombina bombina]|uniref:uncharacterized protein LOC128643238 n=1 Tax=Bombina bombina TaxID=8345 RepID=UPI00235B2B30|nr:uncharacterized protein LOC128643238 [Bombina bombina]
MYLGKVISFVLLMPPLVFSRDLYLTTNGGICTSPCSREDTDYFWCWQEGYSNDKWDYCSPHEGYDNYNSRCVSLCRTYGYSYRWCKRPQGGWRYCGHITEEFEKRNTRYGKQCVSNCDINKKETYFQCYDVNNDYEYCSPSNYVTIKGEPCRLDHPCDFYGNKYSWCYTDEKNNWDYCGKISSDCEKPIHSSNRRKRQPEEEELCRVMDSGNRRVTILVAVQESRLGRLSRIQFTDASHVINMVNSDTTFSTNPGTMITYNTVRLDMQGTFVQQGVRYFNIQIQLNGQRHGQSSIAQALFPVNFEVTRYFRYIRRALQTSMRGAYHEAPVKVFIHIINI